MFLPGARRPRQTGAVTIDRTPLDAFVADYAAEHHCQTVAWGVVRDGSLALAGSFGPDDQHVDEHTVYRIASMTKSFSAAATLLLRDDGVLRLDDPVSAYDPSLDGLRSPTTRCAADPRARPPGDDERTRHR